MTVVPDFPGVLESFEILMEVVNYSPSKVCIDTHTYSPTPKFCIPFQGVHKPP